MKIVWDEPKREKNRRNRNLDFADLDMEFFARAAIIRARNGRLMAVAEFRGVTISVVFRPLGREAISIISMRRASRKERKVL